MAVSDSTSIIIVTAVFAGLAVLFVLLRLRARKKQHAAYLADDYLIVLSVIFCLGYSANVIVAAALGHLGDHIRRDSNGAVDPDPKSLFILSQTLYVSEIFGYFPLTTAKLSILFFYRRIFGVQGKLFPIISLLLIVLSCLWGISFFFATLFICYPIHYSWTSAYGSPEFEAHCYNPAAMFYASAISNLIVDVFILLIPTPMVWPLEMPRKQKIAVVGIFLLGGFVVAITAIRVWVFLYTGPKVEETQDITYGFGGVIRWSQLEICIAIICACLPTLRVIFIDTSLRGAFRGLATKVSTFASSKISLLGDKTRTSEANTSLRNKNSINSLPQVSESGEEIHMHSIGDIEVPEGHARAHKASSVNPTV
ncbi:hypothetical protein F5Y14DRAFT_397364 [Nemania sp. NC0429]|nr:hypothetical protein F5Y14DRAFT_397364 [Nemania sp. NC0429]